MATLSDLFVQNGTLKSLSEVIGAPARGTLAAVMGIEKRKDAKGHGSEKHTFGGNVFTTSRDPKSDDNSEAHAVHHKGKQIGSVEHYNGDGQWYGHSMHGSIGYRSGSYQSPQSFSDKKAAVEAVAQRHLGHEKMKAVTDEAKRRADAKKEHERRHGNEYTGDITNLHDHMHVHRVDHNYVSGTSKDGEHAIDMKVYGEGSDYGVDGGRVSMLDIRHKSTGASHAHYDRGWSKIPQTEAHMDMVRRLVGAVDEPKKIKKTVELWPGESGARVDLGPPKTTTAPES
jgi:hypothetical protein